MKPLQSLAHVCVCVWERKPNMPRHPSAQDAHQGKLLPLLPQFPTHTLCPFLAICMILMSFLCKCAKLREMRFTGLAEAEAIEQRESKLSRSERQRTRRTGESRREGTQKARGKLDQLP